MSHLGPIVVIEDDEDDRFLIRQSLSELEVENECLYFSNGQQAFDYLLTTKDQPFIILCDMNMPLMNGLELRAVIESNSRLKEKAVPFIFLSTSNNEQIIRAAYRGTIQGFYQKASDYKELKQDLAMILGYWRMCLHPNNLTPVRGKS